MVAVQGQIKQAIQRQLAGFENWQVTTSDKPYIDLFDNEQRANLVYLTADSEQEMGELAPEDILIIGGLVDRNRHKNICFNRAKKQVSFCKQTGRTHLDRTMGCAVCCTQIVNL